MTWLGLLARVSVVSFCLTTQAVMAQEFVGHMRVIDGDTLAIDELHLRLRLESIDAPELIQTCTDQTGRSWPCGLEAARALTCFTARQVVQCAGSGGDRYGRPLVTCMAGGVQLNHEMVRRGWAVPYYAATYSDAAAEARSARRGLWRGTFDTPAQWRRDRRDIRAAPATRPTIPRGPCPELAPVS